MNVKLINRETRETIWETEICQMTAKIFRTILVELYDQTANVRENRRLMAVVTQKGKEVIRLLSADEAERFVVWVSRDNGQNIREVWAVGK